MSTIPTTKFSACGRPPLGSRVLLASLEAIEGIIGDQQYKKEGLLIRQGWHHTSSTPGCIWMWEKVLEDGRTALVTTETALAFERWWAELAALHDDSEANDQADSSSQRD